MNTKTQHLSRLDTATTMNTSATTITTSTTEQFLASAEILDNALNAIYDLAVYDAYNASNNLTPHNSACEPECSLGDLDPNQKYSLRHKTYQTETKALGNLAEIQNAILIIRNQVDLARIALSKLEVNAGVEPDDYANDQLPER